jgi:hypothetical protein
LSDRDKLTRHVGSGSDCGSGISVYTFISGRQDEARKRGCSLLPIGARKYRKLEPVNQGAIAFFQLEMENSESCSFLQVGALE